MSKTITIKQIIKDLQHLPVSVRDGSYPPYSWQAEAEHFVENEKVVSAVKVIRAATGWSLLECKKNADFYQDNRYWDIEATLRGIIEQKSITISQINDELQEAEDKLAIITNLLMNNSRD